MPKGQAYLSLTGRTWSDDLLGLMKKTFPQHLLGARAAAGAGERRGYENRKRDILKHTETDLSNTASTEIEQRRRRLHRHRSSRQLKLNMPVPRKSRCRCKNMQKPISKRNLTSEDVASKTRFSLVRQLHILMVLDFGFCCFWWRRFCNSCHLENISTKVAWGDRGANARTDPAEHEHGKCARSWNMVQERCCYDKKTSIERPIL